MPGSPISNFWSYSTMLIENAYNGYGTGFLVFKSKKSDNNLGNVYLVTNKHVIGKNQQLRDTSSPITLHLNVKDSGIIKKHRAEVSLNNNTLKFFREHPSIDVDVLAIDITQLLVEFPFIETQLIPFEMLATSEKIKEMDIKIGDEIIVIGYPEGIRHSMTNFPLIRDGIIASRIGEKIEDEYKENGKYRKRILRGFLVDGAIIPGSSGSPIVLKPLSTRYFHEKIKMQTFPQIVLGIIAESRYAPIRTPTSDFLSYAGLGLAFDGETIIETINLFEF